MNNQLKKSLSSGRIYVVTVGKFYKLREWDAKRSARASELKTKDGIPMVRLKLKCAYQPWCYDGWHDVQDVVDL